MSKRSRVPLAAPTLVLLILSLASGGVNSVAHAGVSMRVDRSTGGSPSAGGAQLWTARYDGPAHGGVDSATALAVSPNGSVVYVTGASDTELHDSDYATVAYSSSSGHRLWVERLGLGGAAYDVATSPDGSRIFVTGQVSVGDTADYGTVAYDPSGTELWFARYDGGGGLDIAVDLAVSSDGSKVFVTGSTTRPGSFDLDYTTVAYDASTGDQLWVAVYNGANSMGDAPAALALSPDGQRVYVTGASEASNERTDYATVGYDAGTGMQLWVATYNGPANLEDNASSVGVSPDGSRVYVTGISTNLQGWDFVTQAYDAVTGATLWTRRETDGGFPASGLAVSPSGRTVFVTGESDGGDYLTVAYNASTGRKAWASTYDDGSGDTPAALALSPDGTRLFVTGSSNSFQSGLDYATVAYDSGSGTQLWVARYDGPSHLYDEASAIAVSPNGRHVCVTGYSNGFDQNQDYLTVAYQA